MGDQEGDEADEESAIIMNAFKRGPYKVVHKRSYKEWRKHNRTNTAWKTRLLWMPDGTCWRRQKGLRHLKTKKRNRRLKRLAKLVMIRKQERKRVFRMTGRRVATPTAATLIRRKFPY